MSVPALIDAAAAAELLGVPKSWVMEQARRERLPYVPLGRYKRFDPDELLIWARARQRGPISSRR